MTKVELTKSAYQALKKLPLHIVKKLQTWVVQVEMVGLQETRKLGGFHDEPLKGNRQGQRSIRLNRSYRAIYTEGLRGEIKLVTIIEVNKHDY